jgi:hypothetical protein
MWCAFLTSSAPVGRALFSMIQSNIGGPLGKPVCQFTDNRERRWKSQFFLGAAGVLALAAPSWAVIGVDIDFAPVKPVVDNQVLLNNTVGASALYSATTYTPTFSELTFSLLFNGDFGQGSTLAVVDLGLIDNSNPALTRVTTYFNINLPTNPASAPPANLIGDHATEVAQFAAGYNQTTTDSVIFYTGLGIAPLANIWSGSIIDSGDPAGTNTQTTASAMYPFVQAMAVGVNGTTADVVNVSLGAQGVPASEDFFSNAVDGLAAANPHSTVVIATGNSGPEPGTVESPAVAFNGITVAALASDPTLGYQTASDYSSRGPADFYNPYTGVTLSGVRPAVDIAAPGDYFVIQADPVGNGEYGLTVGAGTSFATPLVSGAVAQLTAYTHGLAGLAGALVGLDPNINQQLQDATDSRVIKAVLMNAADKTLGWDNGQQTINGIITTSQALDLTVGAGRLNIARAADNYLNGNFDPKVVGTQFVGPKGWDLSTVTARVPNIYDLGTLAPGQALSATLDWFADDSYDAVNLNPSIDSFTDLDLEVLEVISPGVTQEIAISDAEFNNVQLLSFPITSAGDYELQVLYAGLQFGPPGDPGNSESYALAWSNVYVPEPGSIAGVAMVLLGLGRRRRTGKRSTSNAQHSNDDSVLARVSMSGVLHSLGS